MGGSKTPERIIMKLCMMVGFSDVVTRAKLDGIGLAIFVWWGIEFQVFPCDFGSRPYNPL